MFRSCLIHIDLLDDPYFDFLMLSNTFLWVFVFAFLLETLVFIFHIHVSCIHIHVFIYLVLLLGGLIYFFVFVSSIQAF